MSVWHFIVALLVLAVVGVFALVRDGARREAAFMAAKRRAWDRERYEANPELRP